MIIYLLRHEERHPSCLFNSSLTSDGLSASKDLVNQLKLLDVSQVYCSPFLRNVQTIEPYCVKTHKKVRCEPALYEFLGHKDFVPENYRHTWKEHHLSYQSIIDPNYCPFLDTSGLQFPESDIDYRIRPFITYLLKTNADKSLLVSHMTPINAILSFFDPNHSPGFLYPTGCLTQITLYKSRVVIESLTHSVLHYCLQPDPALRTLIC